MVDMKNIAPFSAGVMGPELAIFRAPETFHILLGETLRGEVFSVFGLQMHESACENNIIVSQANNQ